MVCPFPSGSIGSLEFQNVWGHKARCDSPKSWRGVDQCVLKSIGLWVPSFCSPTSYFPSLSRLSISSASRPSEFIEPIVTTPTSHSPGPSVKETPLTMWRGRCDKCASDRPKNRRNILGGASPHFPIHQWVQSSRVIGHPPMRTPVH